MYKEYTFIDFEDFQFITKKNLFTIYKKNDKTSDYDMNITICLDYESYVKNDKNILIFYLPDIYITNNLRGKKNSYILFLSLCIFLFKKYKESHIFIKLDDCSGYNYKNNLYSKLYFYVEQENKNIIVHPYKWISDGINNNPSELRYGYIPLIIYNCMKNLNIK